MQTVIRGGRLGLRAMRGVACQMSKSNPSNAPNGWIRNSLPKIRQQSGVRQSVGGHNQSRISQRTSSGGAGSGGGVVGGGGGGGGGGSGGSGAGGEGGLGRSLWAAYLALLNRRPLATKSVTAALLNGLGDAIAQWLFERDSQFDWKRLSIFAFLGLILIGPSLHVWYGTLGRVVTATGSKGTLLKLLADQLFFAPIFISSVITFLMTMEGQQHAVGDKLKQDLFTILKSNWILWIPFQFLNFRFVPVYLQVFASNVVALGWNIYMSFATHRKVTE